jgi:hypothetical protein
VTPVPYESFLPHVLPYVPACFDAQAVIAVRNACIDFCRDTLLLQEDLDPISTVVGENACEITTPAGYILAQVLSLYYVGRRLERKSQLELEKLYTRDWQSLVGAPQVFTQFNQEEVTVTPRPAEALAGAITGRIALVPSRSSTEVDGVLLERYLDDVAAGALARLLTTPDQPYTNIAAAGMYATKFRAGVAQARAFVNGGMNRAPLRVRFQRI